MAEPRFVKGVTLFSATTLVIGSMIGSGIFIVPSIMAGYVSSPTTLLILWVVGGLFTILGAQSFGELSAAFPKAGGPYVFLKEAFSPFFGFLYGWGLFFVIQTGLIAAVAMAFAKYLGVFVPWVGEGTGFSYFNTVQMTAIVSILVLTGINCLGVKVGACVQNLFTILKVLVPVAIMGLGVALSKGSFSHFSQQSALASSAMGMGFAAALAVALSKALFAYDGWVTLTFASEEVQNPQRTIPLALTLGTLGVTAFYVIATAFYIYMVPPAEMAGISENRVAAEAALRVLGPAGLWLISAAIMISTFGCNNGLILGGARVYYAMAQDKFFFKSAGRLHPKYATPTSALIYQAVWASLLTLSGTYSDLLTYVAFASVLFTILAVAGLMVLRWKRPDLPRPVRCFGYPLVPLLYIAIGLAFTFYLIQGDLRNSLMGLGLIATGIPVYLFQNRFGRSLPSHI